MHSHGSDTGGAILTSMMGLRQGTQIPAPVCSLRAAVAPNRWSPSREILRPPPTISRLGVDPFASPASWSRPRRETRMGQAPRSTSTRPSRQSSRRRHDRLLRSLHTAFSGRYTRRGRSGGRQTRQAIGAGRQHASHAPPRRKSQHFFPLAATRTRHGARAEQLLNPPSTLVARLRALCKATFQIICERLISIACGRRDCRGEPSTAALPPSSR